MISGGRRARTALRSLPQLVGERAAPSPEERILEAEQREAVRSALRTLTMDARVALLLSAQGFSAREIGTTLGRTDAAVRTLLSRSRLRLREHLSAAAPADAILPTNTSALSVAAIAAATAHPERVIGLHFFNPAPLMPLVEIVRAERSADEAVVTAYALGERLVLRLGRLGGAPAREQVLRDLAVADGLHGLELGTVPALQQPAHLGHAVDRREAGPPPAPPRAHG